MDKTFRGRFEIKLDAKGRLSLPQALRSVLPEAPDKSCQIVVTNSQYMKRPCLHVYSISEWRKLEARIAKLSPLKAEVQAFQRFYLSGGQVVEVDAQNRVLVPQGLRKYAELDSQLVLVGMGDKVEVWSEEAWSRVHQELAASFEETMSAVALLDGEDS